MSDEIIIHANHREATGKSAVKKMHQQGQLPAVVYGHNFEAVHLSLDSAVTNKMFRIGSEVVEDYKLCKLIVDDKPDMQETMVIVKDIQRHPITDIVLHIDFFAVRMDEAIVAPVHIRLHGKPEGVKLGGILRHILREVEVKSLPADIPGHFDLDVSKLNIGDSLHVSDLQVADNAKILNDPQAAVVNILAPTVTKDETEEGEEGAEEGAEAKESAEAEAKE